MILQAREAAILRASKQLKILPGASNPTNPTRSVPAPSVSEGGRAAATAFEPKLASTPVATRNELASPSLTGAPRHSKSPIINPPLIPEEPKKGCARSFVAVNASGEVLPLTTVSLIKVLLFDVQAILERVPAETETAAMAAAIRRPMTHIPIR